MKRRSSPVRHLPGVPADVPAASAVCRSWPKRRPQPFTSAYQAFVAMSFPRWQDPLAADPPKRMPCIRASTTPGPVAPSTSWPEEARSAHTVDVVLDQIRISKLSGGYRQARVLRCALASAARETRRGNSRRACSAWRSHVEASSLFSGAPNRSLTQSLGL